MNAMTYRNTSHRSWRRADLAFLSLIGGCAVVTSLVIVLITVFLFNESLPAIRDIGIGRFFVGDGWWPLEHEYNLTPMLISSLALTFGALLITAPIAVVYAIFCTYYASPRVSAIFRRLVDISSAVPTVVYGFWGLVVVVPFINDFVAPGTCLLAGMLVLSLMIFPTIAVFSHSAISAVPVSYLHAGTALGVKEFSLIWHVILPSARRGILAAMILGTARAIGETMVVLMVCGNVVQTPTSLLDPVRALTANIALEMPYAMGDHRSSLYVTGFIVLLVVTCLVLLSEIYGHRQSREAQ
jgi:phosphate transport system permease protein